MLHPYAQGTSKPTRADYSATPGSQTARHNATHLLNTKRPKSILHSKKISVAFQSRGWLQTDGIQNARDHSRLIALTVRRDFKETRSKRCLQTSRLETLTFFNKVYFFFNQYIVRVRSLSISFWSRCDTVIRPRGFTLETPLVIVRECPWAYVFKSGGKNLWKCATHTRFTRVRWSHFSLV